MTGLVSCFMVTRHRGDIVRRAVWCFQKQSYPQLELVVVHEDEDGTREYLAGLGDERIRYVRPDHLGLNLSELRNFGISQARGDYVARWDDDDWHHPDRISLQLLALEQARADLCLLERGTLAWPDRQQFLLSKRMPWEVTLLARRSKLPSYPSKPQRKHSEIVDECHRQQLKLCTLDRPDLYIYTVHDRSTDSSDHIIQHIFGASTGRLETDEVTDVLKKLRQGLSPSTALRLGVGPTLPPRPSVCVLVQVRKRAHHLIRAVTSVIGQLEPQDELILVDEGSTGLPDQRSLEPFRRRILWLRNQSLQNGSASRNQGITRSRADWIKLLDSDEVLAPFALDIIRSERWSIPPTVQVVSGSCHRFTSDGYLDCLVGTSGDLASICSHNPVYHGTAFVRRQAVLDAGLFDLRLDDREAEWELWLRLHERLGPTAFYFVAQPACFVSLLSDEPSIRRQPIEVDGMSMRDWLLKRYGPKAL